MKYYIDVGFSIPFPLSLDPKCAFNFDCSQTNQQTSSNLCWLK